MPGQLPKAYLRIDPNLDQTHADPGAFVRLLCAGARQPKRGIFKSWDTLVNAVGKRLAVRFRDEWRDVKEVEGGAIAIDGWADWQEGDMTVGERVRRFREKHSPSVTPAVTGAVTAGVTPPVSLPLPPSEALGVIRSSSGTPNNASKQARTRERDEPDGEQPPTAATPEQARDLALSKLGPPANPMVAGRRAELEGEAFALVREIADLTGRYPEEVFADAAHYEGAKRQKVNPASMTDDRLLNTLIDLRATLKTAQTNGRTS